MRLQQRAVITFIVALLTAGLATAGTAAATTVRYTDRHDTGAADLDITRVAVKLTAATTTATVNIRDVKSALPREVDVHFDTDGDPASEYIASFSSNLHRFYTGNWTELPRCSGTIKTAWSAGRNYVRVTVPTSCLDQPTRLRTHVFAVDGSKAYDSAPNRLTAWSAAATTSYPTDINLTSTPPSQVYVTAGARYHYKGTVSGPSGRPIHLQKDDGSTWATVASGTTDSNGRFDLTWAPDDWTTQTAQLRLEAPAAGKFLDKTTTWFSVTYNYTPTGPRVVTERISGNQAVVYQTAANGTGRTTLYTSDQPAGLRHVSASGRLIEADHTANGTLIRTIDHPGNPWTDLTTTSPGTCVTDLTGTDNGTWIAFATGTPTGNQCAASRVTAVKPSTGQQTTLTAPSSSASHQVLFDNQGHLGYRIGTASQTLTLGSGAVINTCDGATNISDLTIGAPGNNMPFAVHAVVPRQGEGYWMCFTYPEADPYTDYTQAYDFDTSHIHHILGSVYDGNALAFGDRTAADPGPYYDVLDTYATRYTPHTIPFQADAVIPGAAWLNDTAFALDPGRVTVHTYDYDSQTIRQLLTLPVGEQLIGTYDG